MLYYFLGLNGFSHVRLIPHNEFHDRIGLQKEFVGWMYN